MLAFWLLLVAGLIGLAVTIWLASRNPPQPDVEIIGVTVPKEEEE